MPQSNAAFMIHILCLMTASLILISLQLASFISFIQVVNLLTSSRELVDLMKDIDTVFHSKPAGSSKSMLNTLYQYVPALREQLEVIHYLYQSFAFFKLLYMYSYCHI